MIKKKIILGTVQFGLNYGINNSQGKPTQEEINQILSFAYDNGIVQLDTAEAYGNAHDLIGSFHRLYPSKRFEIITKLPHILNDSLEFKIEKYLKQLNVDNLGGMLFHSYDTYKNNKEAISILHSFKLQGIIKKIGVSVYTNAQIEDVLQNKLIDVIQLPFNMLDNLKLRGEVLYKARELGKIIHTRSAFLQGLFFKSLSDDAKIVQSLKNELKQLHEISDRYQIPLQKIALSYCLQQTLIDNVLIGVDNLQQLNQNLEDSYYLLPENVVKELDNISIDDLDLLNPSLWN